MGSGTSAGGGIVRQMLAGGQVLAGVVGQMLAWVVGQVLAGVVTLVERMNSLNWMDRLKCESMTSCV